MIKYKTNYKSKILLCITSHGIGNNLKSDPAGVYCDILRGAAVIDGVCRVDLALLRERRGGLW